MGYRKIPTIYTLTDFEDEPGLIVRMKAIKLGKVRKLVRLTDNENANDLETLDEIFTLVEEGLVSWNLETEDGTPIPADMGGIEEQELPMLLTVLNAWLEQMTGVDKDLGKDSPSGENFPGRPLTMEAL